MPITPPYGWLVSPESNTHWYNPHTGHWRKIPVEHKPIKAKRCRVCGKRPGEPGIGDLCRACHEGVCKGLVSLP